MFSFYCTENIQALELSTELDAFLPFTHVQKRHYNENTQMAEWQLSMWGGSLLNGQLWLWT